jgi:glutathione synthase/RimK-type ligase-like ATP-grasp enzyme
MKVAIHPKPGTFSDRWIKYCIEKNIDYKIVNCYSSDIIKELSDCDGLMWHWDLNDYKAELFARQLMASLQKKGIRVFPDVDTGWHYDDKVGQKYLLEAIDAPLVTSHVFYSKSEALKWIDDSTFPKVFKLRGGAGSVNVKLVRTRSKARKLVRKSFGRGFPHYSSLSHFKQDIYVFKRDRDYPAVKEILNGFARLFIPKEIEKFSKREKGYIYFQDFIPDNLYDTRLVVVGNRCFGIRRYCRKGDFRASGSGLLEYKQELFDNECIQIAFDVTKKIGAQSLAFDFVIDSSGYKIVEICYCFTMGKAYDDCPGYWDDSLQWHDTEVNPQIFMIEDFLSSIKME